MGVWYRFEVVNQDMLPFVFKYCQVMNMTFRTQYYQQYCMSLVNEKRYQPLQMLSDAVLDYVKPKPFRLNKDVSAAEAA